MKIVRLTPDYQFGSFDCGESDLNEFLLTDAKEYASHLLAVTYIIEDRKDIAAFFSLSNDRISLLESDKATWRRIKSVFPHRKHRSDYPAVKIGRLGVDCRYRGINLGTSILNFVKKAFVTNNRTGCCFITVDALPSATGFYEQNGFHLLRKSDRENAETIPMYFNLSRLV
ncbi:MAG: GNAT family N-acetyltransferase [Bacteroidales bacterium]|nr:GNAT family N-acetyltransferase [Bacteroidales bacterium]